jgi:hypothetical protein
VWGPDGADAHGQALSNINLLSSNYIPLGAQILKKENKAGLPHDQRLFNTRPCSYRSQGANHHHHHHHPNLSTTLLHRSMTLLRAGDQETLSMGRPHGNGRATIMGIGKALPENVFEQKSFPDYYFDITDSKHLVDLKARFAKICKCTFIKYL